MTAADFYKENVNLIHAVSRKGYARLQAAGVAMDYEDVFQEMSVVFLKAYERFDESLGFRFATFFYKAAYNRLNVWAQEMIEERLVHGTVSIEEMNTSEDEEFNLQDVLMVDHETPEDHCRIRQFIRFIESSLSPLARLIVNWMVAPPEELMEEIRKAEANAEFGRSLGFNCRCMARITPRYVAGFIRMISTSIQESDCNKALKEIDRLRYVQAKQFIGA